MVLDGPDALHLRLDGIHDPDGIDVPDDGWLPVDRGQNAFQRLIGGDLIAAFLPAHPHQRVGKERVVPCDLELYNVGMYHFFHALHLLKWKISLFLPEPCDGIVIPLLQGQDASAAERDQGMQLL